MTIEELKVLYESKLRAEEEKERRAQEEGEKDARKNARREKRLCDDLVRPPTATAKKTTAGMPEDGDDDDDFEVDKDASDDEDDEPEEQEAQAPAPETSPPKKGKRKAQGGCGGNNRKRNTRKKSRVEEEEEEEVEEDSEEEEEEDDLGSIVEVKKFMWKKKAFEVKWSIYKKNTVEAAAGVIADCPEETLQMIWQHSRRNVRVADWINGLDGMDEVIRRWNGGVWDGIERLAASMGWEGAFRVPEAAAANGAGTSRPAIVGNETTETEDEPETPRFVDFSIHRQSNGGDSPFDSYRRTPIAPPRRVSCEGNNNPGEMSEIEDSGSEKEDGVEEENGVGTMLHILCSFGHKWEELDSPTYSCVVGRDCYKCGASLAGVKRSNLAHHCMIPVCDITVCSICRGSYDLTTPPRTRGRGTGR